MGRKFRTTMINFEIKPARVKIGLRKNPYMLQLDKQINIAKLKRQFESVDEYYESFDRKDNKSIGVAVTEKRTPPESSICEITVLSDRIRGRSPLESLKLYYSKRQSCFEERRMRLNKLEKIAFADMADVQHPDPIIVNKSCISAYTCFRPTRMMHRKEAERKYFNIKRRTCLQFSDLYSNSICIQTEESPGHDLL